MEKEEVELIKRVRGGDKMAFQEIMNRYGERVMCLSYHFTKNHQDAEDLYQDVFIKVYRKIDTFRFESEFFTWIYRILANMAFNYHKKRKRMSYVDPGESDYLWETIPGDEVEEAETITYLSITKEEIDSALNRLSVQQKVVFILKHYEGQKIKDIAALLELTEGTVKRYLFRATRKLQSILVKA